MSQNSAPINFSDDKNKAFQHINLDIESGVSKSNQTTYEEKYKLALAQAASQQQQATQQQVTQQQATQQKQPAHQHHAGCKHKNHGDSHGDSHGHSHKHGEEHGHGKDGDSSSHKRNQMFQKHAWKIRLFTSGVPIQGYIITMLVSPSKKIDFLKYNILSGLTKRLKIVHLIIGLV